MLFGMYTMKNRIIRQFLKFIASRYQNYRILFYTFLSTNKYKGNPKTLQPFLSIGDGEITFGKKTVIGYFPSPYYYNGYCHFEARTKESRIFIGDNVHINNNLSIISEVSIEIGDNTLIGTNVELYDSDFHVISRERHGDKNYNKEKIVIGKNVWIGSNVKILKGVEIGENSIISNGSIVNKSIPSNVVAGGIPAKVIKDI